MAFVGVEHLGCRGAGQPLEDAQRLHAAHAQQQLLLQPVVAAAAVQAVGDAAGGVVVARRRWSPGAAAERGRRRHARCVRSSWRPLGRGSDHLQRPAVPSAVAEQRQRQPVRVQHRVGLLLPGVAGEGLLEVAGLVQQADADQRDAEVRGGLQVVTGEDAEAARVLREDFGDAVLRGEVGDAARCVRRRGPGTSGVRPGTGRDPLPAALIRSTTRSSAASCWSCSRLTEPRKATGSWPLSSQTAGSRSCEKTRGRPVPRPAQIAGQLAERRDAARGGRYGL